MKRFEEGELFWFTIKVISVVVIVLVLGLLLDGVGLDIGA